MTRLIYIALICGTLVNTSVSLLQSGNQENDVVSVSANNYAPSLLMVMVMNLYSSFSIFIFKCALQANDLWVRSDISIYRRSWQPLISPLTISPSTLTNERKPGHNTGNFATSVWVLLRPTGLCEQ